MTMKEKQEFSGQIVCVKKTVTRHRKSIGKLGALPEKYHVDIREHKDFPKVMADVTSGKITDEQFFSECRRMKMSMVRPDYHEYVAKKTARELAYMFG